MNSFEIGPRSPLIPSEARGRSISLPFQNTYARLPERFHARLNPIPVAAPRLLKLNEPLARFLGLDPDALTSKEGVEVLAGNRVAHGSEPLAIAYAGHQFGHFVPQLGDGRANLLGEVVAQDSRGYDLQLKGSGPTPFSRRGDGRAVVGPVLREYLVSEAMAALGVPTTRALAAVATGERVLRETVQPGAVLTRVAASHLRVGTFQYFAVRGDTEALHTLADYAIARHYPHAAQADRPYAALLQGIIARQADLVAQWMSLGFVHGVMNTDNTSISGETLDYGPCAFMEAYDPDTVFSSIDVNGRYAYSNQPYAVHWNLTRLAESLLPLLEQEQGGADAALAAAKEALAAFEPQFERARLQHFRHKLGLFIEREDDEALLQGLLGLMAAQRADFTLTFRHLCDAALGPEHEAGFRNLLAHPTTINDWLLRWRQRLMEEPASAEDRLAAMQRSNPIYIPRNHQVDSALRAAAERDDLAPFHELLEVVLHPYTEQETWSKYALPARPEECITKTFCGT